MPTALEKQITAGAQEFLGAHAYFFTEGRIPTNVSDHSRYFHIHDVRRRDGSWEASFVIDIATEFFKEYKGELIKSLAAEAALITKVGFFYLVRHSYKSWKERRPLTERTFDRVEPVLTEHTGNRAPIFDLHAEQDKQRRRLFERANSSMSKITAPVGRAASHVDVWLNDQRLDHIERKFISEDDISAALSTSFRAKLELQNRV